MREGSTRTSVSVDGLGGEDDDYEHDNGLKDGIQNPSCQCPGPEIDIPGACLVQTWMSQRDSHTCCQAALQQP